VLQNIGQLLPPDFAKKYLSPLEQYCLGMVALFHDVGNIYGRERHNEKIRDIYKRVRQGPTEDRDEMKLVLMAAKAHTGRAADGTKDTLKDLPNDFYYQGERVRLREIAAILRLADELAEGPQRTSTFLLENHGYDKKSKIYHRYAQAVRVNIDRERGLVALTYHLAVRHNGQMAEGGLPAVMELLEFTFKRLLKLDEERRYTKFYCDALSAFKATSAVYRFWIDDDDQQLEVPSLLLDDKVVPGDSEREIPEIEPTLSPSTIESRLRQILEKEGDKQSL
jgi:hypothetical protein